MEIKQILPTDIQNAFDVSKRCTLQTNKTKFMEQYNAHPELFRAVYDQNNIVGVCHAAEHENHLIIIHGIAVEPAYSGKGLGGKLLKEIEIAAKKLGGKTLSVGSAAGYVEKFYIKNGFKPIHFIAIIPKEQPINKQEFNIINKREQGNDLELTI